MKNDIKTLIIIAVIAALVACTGQDPQSKAKEEREAAVSKALSKLDHIEAANIRECMAKFGTSENVSAVIKGQILECKTKRCHLIGKI
jgi:uncharacterized membrane protein